MIEFSSYGPVLSDVISIVNAIIEITKDKSLFETKGYSKQKFIRNKRLLSLEMVKGGKDSRSFRLTKRKKRKFAGNQFPKSVADTPAVNVNITEQEEQMSMVVDNEIPGPSLTSTEAKLEGKLPKVKENTCKILLGNRFMDMEVLSSVFQVVACPNCSNNKLELSESKKNGLASQMDLKCSKCLWNHSSCNSKKTQRAHNINRRAFYAILRIGGGYQSLKQFLMLMDHQPPMTEKNYRTISNIFNQKIIVAEKLKHVKRCVI